MTTKHESRQRELTAISKSIEFDEANIDALARSCLTKKVIFTCSRCHRLCLPEMTGITRTVQPFRVCADCFGVIRKLPENEVVQ